MMLSVEQILIGIIALGLWGFVGIICLSRIGCKRVKAICIDDGQVENPNYSETKDEIRRLIGGHRAYRNAPYHYRASFEWEQDGQYYRGSQPVGFATKCVPGREYTVLAKPGRSVITLGQIIWSTILPIILTIAFFGF
jgi:hypothetical protein